MAGPHPTAKYLRKIIRITAEQSPNVRYARQELAAGLKPSGYEPVPGVLSWELYRHRRKTWDVVRQTVGLDADFYRGAELLLYPPEWLNLAETRWAALQQLRIKRKAKGIGCDPAEGGDRTAMCALDEYGIIELVSRKTPITDDVPRELAAFMRKHGLYDKPERVCIDRGGGGKWVADFLRRGVEMGGPGLAGIRTVGFGDPMTEDPKYGVKSKAQLKAEKEHKYEYTSRRAQMFGEFSEWFDPGMLEEGPRCALPPDRVGEEYRLLRHEMAPIPKTYNPEGTLFLIPKHHDPKRPKENQVYLEGLIGWSPDRLDAAVLAYHAMVHDAPVLKVGATSFGGSGTGSRRF